LLELVQDQNNSMEEKLHSEKNWKMMLTTLKTVLEKI
jgi:hypothetical protein